MRYQQRSGNEKECDRGPELWQVLLNRWQVGGLCYVHQLDDEIINRINLNGERNLSI
jgi:hypothetical protein